jgi:excisionase family DNA binding protein
LLLTSASKTQVERLAFTLTDAASAIGVGKSTLHELIATGKLPVRKLGRRSLVLREDLEAYLQALPTRRAGRRLMSAATSNKFR